MTELHLSNPMRDGLERADRPTELAALAGVLDPTLYGRAGRDETSPRRSLYLEMKRSRLWRSNSLMPLAR